MRGRVSYRAGFWRTSGALAAMVAVLGAGGGWAQEAPPSAASIRAGAVEAGVSGMMNTVEGITSGLIALRAGSFVELWGGLGGLEARIGFRHISSLDELDLGAVVTWQRRVGEAGNYPFVSVGGGLRHEKIGSFDQTRYALGFGAGWRTLFGERVALRVQYDFRRIFNDPVANFSEHNVTVGVSLFFRNGVPEMEETNP